MDPHRLAEERSIALHRVVAERIAADRTIVEGALERVERREREGLKHPFYAEAWRRLLLGPIEELRAALVDPSEYMRALRQCTPFTFVVEPRVRSRIWRDTKSALEGTDPSP